MAVDEIQAAGSAGDALWVLAVGSHQAGHIVFDRQVLLDPGGQLDVIAVN